MFPSARLKLLQQQKQELLCTSEVQRRLLGIECAAIENRLAWLDGAVNLTRRAAPFLNLAVPLWRTFSARSNGESSWFKRITNVLPFAGRIANTVQQFIQR